jgi:hypothetical protein
LANAFIFSKEIEKEGLPSLEATHLQDAEAQRGYGYYNRSRGGFPQMPDQMLPSGSCGGRHQACDPFAAEDVAFCSNPVCIALPAAEQNATVSRQISAGWGCVTLLCNPDSNIPQAFLTGWANRVAQELNYSNVPQTPQEGRLVSAGGLLQIAWPRRVAGAAAPLDFLLATATRPTLTGTPVSYPTVEMIANAWNADTGNHVEYFWKNNDNGIRTFQDDAILQVLHPRGQGQA